jgi:hypothetical protein
MKRKIVRKLFEVRTWIYFLFTLFVLAPTLMACQRMVEKEKMEAIGQWSIAMCKCAEKSDAAEAKSCAEALKKPELSLLNSSGRPQYKLDSVHVFDSIESTGSECQRKIMSP